MIETEPSQARQGAASHREETRAATAALARWPLPAGAVARLINLAENLTFLVEAPGGARAILRRHRGGYHTTAAIRSELAWSAALTAESGVSAPAALPGRDGDNVQTVGGRRYVLFAFIEGRAPDDSEDLAPAFQGLGALAARTHLHSLGWRRPPGFMRQRWDIGGVFGDAAFGAAPIWGGWRAAPNVGPAERPVLERAEAELRRRLGAYGAGPERFGLIHADMRLANLLIDQGETRLIDFDDCGFGWLMYDFAAAVSFIEDDPQVSALKAAWLSGYRTVRPLPRADEAIIDAMVMFRRMALLGWVGSRIEATEPQALAPHFARVSADLAERWLTAPTNATVN